MQSFSVVIVGAGPGGLACARILAEHGLDVLVLERKHVIIIIEGDGFGLCDGFFQEEAFPGPMSDGDGFVEDL